MSRLQAGALSIDLAADGRLDEVVARALDDLGDAARASSVDIADDLPAVAGRPGPARARAGEPVANALRYAPPSAPPQSRASALGDRVELRVIDRGPGHPADERDQVFAAVPAARRHRQHHRRRPRAGPVAAG